MSEIIWSLAELQRAGHEVPANARRSRSGVRERFVSAEGSIAFCGQKLREQGISVGAEGVTSDGQRIEGKMVFRRNHGGKLETHRVQFGGPIERGSSFAAAFSAVYATCLRNALGMHRAESTAEEIEKEEPRVTRRVIPNGEPVRERFERGEVDRVLQRCQCLVIRVAELQQGEIDDDNFRQRAGVPPKGRLSPEQAFQYQAWLDAKVIELESPAAGESAAEAGA